MAFLIVGFLVHVEGGVRLAVHVLVIIAGTIINIHQGNPETRMSISPGAGGLARRVGRRSRLLSAIPPPIARVSAQFNTLFEHWL